MSNINLSMDNPYGHVTIPRAKLRGVDDATVIANPMAQSDSYNDATNASADGVQNPPPPYMVKEDTEEVSRRCPACCYRCRRK